MMTPLPLASTGACLLQGLTISGRRMVENTFTTAFSASWLTLSSAGAAARAPEVSNGIDSAPRSARRRERSVRVMKARFLKRGGGEGRF